MTGGKQTLFFALLICLALSLLSPLAPEACANLDQTLAKLDGEGHGLSSEEETIIRKCGEKAIPGLLKKIQSKHLDVRRTAGRLLSEMEGLNPSDLPALVKANKQDNGWLYIAISHLGTEEAMQYLFKELDKSKKNPPLELEYALTISGPKALPELIKHFQCKVGCDDSMLYAAYKILWNMGEAADRVIPQLQDIASDTKASDYARRYARELIVHHEEKEHIYINAAALGLKASVQADNFIKQLSSPSRKVRLMAARTLGYIGNTSAVPALTEMLGLKKDFLEVAVAAEALGMLKAIDATERLELIQSQYWYPPTRAVAAKALSAIKGQAVYESIDRKNTNSGFNAYEYFNRVESQCDIKNYPRLKPDLEASFHFKDYRKAASGMEYKSSIDSYYKGMHVNPTVGLKVEGGWLLGSDRGEFGGELVYWRSKDDYYIIQEENIQDLFSTPSGIYAVGGLIHLSFNHGYLFKLTLSEEGKWTAQTVAHLPGASHKNALLTDGRLLFETDVSGSILYSPATGFEMAECR